MRFMSLVCGHCRRTLEYSGEPPKFCAYCGVALHAAVTITYSPGGAAEVSPNAPTLAYGETRTRGGSGDDTATDNMPQQVGGYRLLRLLGSGGMGAVYEAEAPGGQRVALKLISPEFVKHSTSLERFRQEGQLASLIAHPRCVFVLTADEEQGRPYIVMELMPGTTLKDLVEDCGPLPPQDAVAKILDVVEGLQEAHRLGIVHRDVKPSNCFLLPDGRVKVGDFGLSKPLTQTANLTQTGAFLGTVLYAPPEQIKSLVVDYASDVYSVCATLYFLLTGQAPFEHENATTVVAKIISEDPRPPRELRADVPRRLERIVLKGLERSRDRRWQSLDELHEALRALVPSAMSRGALGLRFAAYLIDAALLFGTEMLIRLAVWLVRGPGSEELFNEGSWLTFELGVEITYFTVLEAWFGYSVGKFLLRLRVCPVVSAEPPPWHRVVLRTVIFVLLANGYLPFAYWFDWTAGQTLIGWAVCVALLLGVMRRSNGYRGLHERLSGTRVVQLPWVRPPRRLTTKRTTFPVNSAADGRFETVYGAFHVKGRLWERADEAVLVAEDPPLTRGIHVWVRPGDTAELSPARRNLIRSTRPRWLDGGEILAGKNPAARWDAFFAPAGGPLADVVAPGAALSWTEARPILEEVTDELRAGRDDGTMPVTLSLEQVWVQPDGRAHLLDLPFGDAPAQASEGAALSLIRQTAVLALEGGPRPSGEPPTHIRAVVPRHAGKLLDRLLEVGEPFHNLDELHAALRDTHDRPTETTRSLRVAHIGVKATLLAVGLLWMFAFSGLFGLLELIIERIQVTNGEVALQVARDPNADANLKRHFASLDVDGSLADRVTRQLITDRTNLLRRANQANRPERLIFESLEQVIPWDEDVGRRELTELAVRVKAPGANAPTSRPVRGWTYPFRDLFETFSVALFVLLAAVPATWIVWGFLTRGGLTLRLMGLALVRADGRKAARWQCAWRSLLVWTPVVALLWACILAKTYVPQFYFLQSGLWWLAVALVLAYLVLGIRRPTRTLHDRLAGTYLVPL
jgi:hypothetical protein